MRSTHAAPACRLALEDGTVFTGSAFGLCTDGAEQGGEVVFNTAMCGYQEALTDPSYTGQILVMTAPEMGNYGVAAEDVESRGIAVRGFAVREAMKKGEWAQAANGWSVVLQYLPGDEEAVRERARAQSMLEGGSVIGTVSTDREVRRQQATAQFKADLQRAQSLLSREDYDQAKLAAVTARTRLDLARNVLGAQEFESMSAEAERLIEQVTEESRQFRLAEEQKARTGQQEQSASSQRTEAENRAKKVNEILMTVRKLQMQQKYSEALQVLDSALALDPNNTAALTLRDAIHTTDMYVRFAEAQKRRAYGLSRLEEEALDATIPPRVNVSGPGPRSTNALVTYPEDWQELSDRRIREPDYGASGYREAEANVPTWNRLRTASLPVPFSSGPTLEQAVDYFKNQTKIDFQIEWKALREAGLEPEQTAVTVDAGSMKVDAALRKVLGEVVNKDNGEGPSEPLAFDVRDGQVVITTKSGVQNQQVMVVYDVRDLLFRAPDFDNAPEFNLNQAMQSGGGAGGGGGGAGGGGGGFGGGAGGGSTGR
ncbi:MAG: carbamoyl-phosphate synthase domain-containing protein, partial [Phycisphaerales bacterium]